VRGTPKTQYADSNGVSIAYQVVGEGERDIVFVPGFMSHVELNWEYPFLADFLDELASYARLIVLDKRGTGLSDRAAGLGTFEERMDDVRAVMDAAGSERAHLVGTSEGGAACVLLAASDPARIASLTLSGAACPGAFDLDDRAKDAMLGFIRSGWHTGRVLDFFVQHPTDRDQALAALARFERYCCEPSIAEEIMRRILESDIRDVVPSVTVPTLVLHNRHDPVVPVAHGEFYRDHIPGAECTIFDLDFHGSWQTEQYRPFLDAIRRFVTGDAAAPAPRVDRVLSTVLFTDIADSTARAAEMGDGRWRKLLDGHDAAAAEEVTAHGGVLVKSTGDGILARFDGPSRAVSCAHSLRRRADQLGLRTRAGAHTGEIEVRGDDVGGIAVHIASRVASLAGPGEVLVSRTVKDLSVGSDVTFEDRGEHALKGVPDSWQIYATTA
jgi:class 3 adenylate cyclase/pimeloyl-ACP methyl ester carboxylesterase